MKPSKDEKSRLGILLTALILSLLLMPRPALAGAYDYQTMLLGGGPFSTRVMVVVRNNGPSTGPNYDIILTVRKTTGELVCETGYSTQSPMAKGVQRTPLAFEFVLPDPKWSAPPGGVPAPSAAPPRQRARAGTLRPGVEGEVTPGAGTAPQWVIEANLRPTAMPNEDGSPANNYVINTVHLTAAGTPTCQKLAGPNGQ